MNSPCLLSFLRGLGRPSSMSAQESDSLSSKGKVRSLPQLRDELSPVDVVRAQQVLL